ncbi:unnamed protein product, partial [Symbiodinium necroappetens]
MILTEEVAKLFSGLQKALRDAEADLKELASSQQTKLEKALSEAEESRDEVDRQRTKLEDVRDEARKARQEKLDVE